MALINEHTQGSNVLRNYKKYTDEDRYKIGKYASENGSTATVRKFKSDFPKLKESTVCDFKRKYEEKLKISKKKGENISTLVTEKRGRPLLLGKLDEMVQKYIKAASNRGAVISRSMASATAKALLVRYLDIVGMIDVENSSWAKTLFQRMGYSRRKATTAKLELPPRTRKEVELVFYHQIIEKVEKHKIPESITLNFDQTPSKYVPVSTTTLAKRNSKQVRIKGSDDKRTITATFTITLDGKFLGMQLIYGGKTVQSLPQFKLPQEFSLSVNKKHYSNEAGSIKLTEEIILPYVKEERKRLSKPDQAALVRSNN